MQKVKSVRIMVELENDRIHTIWLNFDELTALVGALNIYNDFLMSSAIAFIDAPDITEEHMEAMQTINTDKIQHLLTRLFHFVRDREIA